MAKRYRLPLFATRIGLPNGSKEAYPDGWFYPDNEAEEDALVSAGCQIDDLLDPDDIPGSSSTLPPEVQAIVDAYNQQPSAWYSGELNSVVTPNLTADGDLTSATDQLPLKWLAVINPDDDVAAAQALMDGGPNVVEVLPGAQKHPIVYADDGVTPQVIERIYAVCVSSSAVPANYTGGAFIISDLETDIADVLAQMARLDFSSALGATVARLVATPVYNTHYTQLSIAAGVVA